MISSLTTVEQLLWAISKHAISRLDFVDCVIYLLDSEEKQLIQQAAYGPKNPIEYEIIDPITIPLGKGIVGTVAQTGVAELIPNTLEDDRYIVDDDFRLSELAVPIIFENRVLGVIDSEHPEENFYDQYHLDILVTLASMVAPRIAFIQASDQALLDKNTELQKTVERLEQTQQALIEAKDAAESASLSKSTFIYQMSHELRTPLNAIIGYSELLIEELIEAKGSDGLIQDLNRIEYSGKHLLNVVNHILDISKIEANEMPLLIQEESINSLIHEAVIAVTPIIRHNNNEFIFYKLDQDYLIATDGQKLKQILINLLGNAAKFTSNGVIELIVTLSEEKENPMISFQVTDTGLGIKQAFIPNLFKPFQQDKETNNRGGIGVGSGLGLAISKHLARLLGGNIKAESEEGVGSKFTVTIPFEPI